MNYKKYSDKYFLRSKKILEKENINPWVKMQCFIRKGPGKIAGIDEAVQLILKHSDIQAKNGKIYALEDGVNYNSTETVMLIEAPLQSIIELETLYLGIITAETTKLNDNRVIDLKAIKENMQKIVNMTKRPVLYFGARHWRYDEDAAISKAAFEGGAFGCSTDEGAATVGQDGLGTIPHALVLAFAGKYGKKQATLKATQAFHKHIDKAVNRIALVDTFNKEISDSLSVASELGENLFGVRLDTCGENFGEGCLKKDSNDFKSGRGVTVELAKNLRNALNKNGFNNVKIILSSGFANPEKVRAFIDAEQEMGIKIFDSLGVGQLFYSRSATADIAEVDGKLLSKFGRHLKINKRLVRML